MPKLKLEPLDPLEAIKYFRGKGLAKSFAWQDLWQEEHAKAFTVAKAMKAALLQDIRDALDKALVQGATFAEFKANLQPLLVAQGWWGKQRMTDPMTGEDKTVQLGSPRRLRTIFDVNMRTAYQAGRWERIERTKATLPYLRYEAVLDDRTRPEHAAWHGTTLPAGDDWWLTHYPPCGWKCRCTVSQLSAGQLERSGGGITENPIAFPSRRYTNPRTGEVVKVEGGIDAGWGYNVGKAYLERDTPSPMGPPIKGGGKAGAAAQAADRRLVSAEMILPRDVSAEEAIAAFLGGFGLDPTQSKVVDDPSGDGLVIGPAILKNSVGKPVRVAKPVLRTLPLIGLALRQPDEIWRAWRTAADRPSLLVRRYMARFDVEGRPVDVVIDWGGGGWWADASLDHAVDLDALRASADARIYTRA